MARSALALEAEFEVDGARYRWDGWRWRAAEGRLAPPEAVIPRLNRLRGQATRTAEHLTADVGTLVGLAIRARQSGAPSRAERFARRVLAVEPDNAIAGAILSSVLREKRKPRAALEIADRFQESNHPEVLTSRSAALCDVGRWGEALAQIERVLQIEMAKDGFNSDEALAVHLRIRANAPSRLLLTQ